jgi:integrase
MFNPAASVRGPEHQVRECKTPAISPDQTRAVLRNIDTRSIVGLRDRAVVATMIYTAARAGAVARLRLGDFFSDGRQWFLRFEEKGGKVRDIPCRHDLEEYVQEYVRSTTPPRDRVGLRPPRLHKRKPDRRPEPKSGGNSAQ